MAKLAVIYGTGTGHTGEMAEQIDDGARSEGLETEVILLGNVTEDVPRGGRTMSADDALAIMDSADAVAIGSSTYDMKPVVFVEQLLKKAGSLDLSGRVGTAFGPYQNPPQSCWDHHRCHEGMGHGCGGTRVAGIRCNNRQDKTGVREIGESIARALSKKK
uniref:Flavodoxin-like domain-containing protein n=1 Tax=Candidatus Methanogaster sp. ANME-2c ERB4 TaxID=2759911 RepID=A0A7G9YPM4_9EURY|nr:hypothetical protein DBPBNLAN_00029 [Methanosarcinales archaeon ANME-2c ERB4]QNO49958.1 hypothetical protein FNHNGOKL_00026 [Methanosarcinales archaeon ANME-2c ERB4]